MMRKTLSLLLCLCMLAALLSGCGGSAPAEQSQPQPAAQEAAPELDALKQDAAGTIILDCTELTYISSSGLRLFLVLRKAAAEKGGKVILRNISDNIRNVFMMTGFLNLFEIQ